MIIAAPIVGALLIWPARQLGAFIFGLVNHFVLAGADNVSQVASARSRGIRSPPCDDGDPIADAVLSMERQVNEATARGAVDGIILRYGLFYGSDSPSTLAMIVSLKNGAQGSDRSVGWGPAPSTGKHFPGAPFFRGVSPGRRQPMPPASDRCSSQRHHRLRAKR